MKTISSYPWQPQSTIRGNLAIGNLRENIAKPLKTERGVHIETLLMVIGAVVGCAAQNAAWIEVKDRGSTVPDIPFADAQNGKAIPQAAFLSFSMPTGEKYYFGDLLNSHLSPQPGFDRLTLWALAAGAAVQAGLSQSDVPSNEPMFSHVTRSVGTPDFGMPDVPAKHRPHMALRDAVKNAWPFARRVLLLPLPPQIPADEPPLSEQHWPIIASLVAAGYIKAAKNVLDLKLGLTLVMEAAIAASKVDQRSL